MVQENSNSFKALAKKWGNKALQSGGQALDWAKDNPGKTAGIAAGIAALLGSISSDGASKITTPLITAGTVYALLKGLPMLQNAGNLVGNANYATLEARALMAKGNHLADAVPGAPLFFGRNKAMKRIQQEASRKAEQVFRDEYNKYRNQGKIKAPLKTGNIEEIKSALREVMG